ncbi:hypothetical protein ACFQ0B_13260 [Nonomuraea thailandensis]
MTGPTATPVAATADPSKAAAITAAGVEARVVTRSLDHLDRTKAALDQAAAKAREPRPSGTWTSSRTP